MTAHERLTVTYHREMKQNYLMIAADGEAEQSFETRMLSGNTINGLLKFRVRRTDDRCWFCYEITSRQPLARLLERKSIGAVQIRQLLLSIAQTLTRMGDYLLAEEQILLDPEYLYVDPEEFQPELCLLPGRTGDFPREFSDFLQFLLGKTDHQDKEAVVMIYGMYQESLKENYGLDNLLKWLLKDRTLSPEEECGGSGNETETEEIRNDREAGEWALAGRETDEEKPFNRAAGRRLSAGRTAGKRLPPDRTAGKRLPPDRTAGKRLPPDSTAGKRLSPDSTAGNRLSADNAAGKRLSANSMGNRQTPAAGTGSRHTSTGNAAGRHPRKSSQAESSGRPLFPAGPIVFLAGLPFLAAAAVWLWGGTEILFRYGPIWVGAVFLLSAGGILFCIWNSREKSRRVSGSSKEQGSHDGFGRQEDLYGEKEPWEMIFAEDPPEEEDPLLLERSLRTDPSPAADPQGSHTRVLWSRTDRDDLRRLAGEAGTTETIPVSYYPFLIGKQENLADFVLDRDTVSRLHVRIDRRDSAFWLTDLNSTNGTAVNGKTLEANETVRLNIGDQVDIADLRFRFE